MTTASALHQRWRTVVAPLLPDPDHTWQQLATHYNEPHRHYHTLDHVAACLTWLDHYRHLAADPLCLELALWAHDVIYDPRASDNEARSADWFAQHFADCIRETRQRSEGIRIEVLVPDFRGRMDVALDILEQEAPDVFNHNLESVPSLYKKIRPGSDYQWSLDLLKKYKERRPDVLTKSGLMLGLGETADELIQVMKDMRAHNIDMITLGQYLQPSRDHLPVDRFVTPEEFDEFGRIAEELGP